MLKECRICGIAMELNMSVVDPTLCRWCETSCEREYVRGRGYEIILTTM